MERGDVARRHSVPFSSGAGAAFCPVSVPWVPRGAPREQPLAVASFKY